MTADPAGPDDLRVLIVGEDPLARAALAALLARESGIAVVGQAAPGDEAAAASRSRRAHAVLLDGGLHATMLVDPASRKVASAARVLALVAAGSSPAPVVTAGARGVLPRDADGPRIAAALRAVARGLYVVDETMAAPLFGARRGAEGGSALDDLTPREIEVLQLLAEGLPNKAITERLFISEHTVKFHVNSILSKLGAQGRTEAVVRAARLGLVAI